MALPVAALAFVRLPGPGRLLDPAVPSAAVLAIPAADWPQLQHNPQQVNPLLLSLVLLR